jgi:hypothetical protein
MVSWVPPGITKPMQRTKAVSSRSVLIEPGPRGSSDGAKDAARPRQCYYRPSPSAFAADRQIVRRSGAVPGWAANFSPAANKDIFHFLFAIAPPVKSKRNWLVHRQIHGGNSGPSVRPSDLSVHSCSKVSRCRCNTWKRAVFSGSRRA